MSRRWYQNVGIGGVTYESKARIGSKFWNEGKWDNFIAPLLPDERQTFLELGCNAGLFLKMAQDVGFGRVVGVEGRTSIMEQAKRFRKQSDGSWRLINRWAGGNLSLPNLPLADVVLMSNFHYYLSVPALAALADGLRNRCLYCIIVSAPARRRAGKAFSGLLPIRGYFRDWEELDIIEGVDATGDPAPRAGMFSVLFHGGLESWSVDDLFDRWYDSASKDKKYKRRALPPALTEFFELALAGEEFNLEDTLFYDYWKKRRPRMNVLKFLRYKRDLARDIQANGMNTPIFFDRQHKMLDGIHRLAIAKTLGWDHVLVKIL